MTDIVERLRNRREMINRGHGNVIDVPDEDCIEACDEIERLRRDCAVDVSELYREIERLRAVITRAKDALLDGQSTQWVHDLLVDGMLAKP